MTDQAPQPPATRVPRNARPRAVIQNILTGYATLAIGLAVGLITTPALVHALARDCFYIGALGSKKTHARRLDRLKQQGLSEADIARIHAPIGLPIGAVSPAEIAVAIMAEITARLRQESGEASAPKPRMADRAPARAAS